MFDKLLEKAVQAGVEKAAETTMETACDYNSVTVTSDYLTGPTNTLPPLFAFLPANPGGKWLMAGVGAIGFVVLWITRGFMYGVFWNGFAYGLYAILYGGAVLQSPPGFSVPKVYHFLGWKARVVGAILATAFGLLLCC